jgi:Amt family ammonium transporter
MIDLRINGELEHKGLDLHEHDVRAYPEFIARKGEEGDGVSREPAVSGA